jgi:acyl-CoA synthetase (AMP-forming)/AMP-acid ligase II
MAEQLPVFDRLDDYVFHYAATRPAAEALLFEDRRIAYAAFADTVRLWARALVAHGVHRGDRVAMLCTTRPEHLFCLLAAAHIGAIWVGLNPRFTRGEMQRVLVDARPKILFALPGFEERDFRDDIDTLAAEDGGVETIVSLGEAFGRAETCDDFIERGLAAVPEAALTELHAAVTGEDTPLLVYTSGSSGLPKGVLLRNQALVRRSLTQNEHWPVVPPRTVNYLPINHIGGVHWISAFVLVGGGCERLVERFRPADLIELVERDRLNILLQPPTAYQMLSEHESFGSDKLASLRWVVWSGGAMPADTVKRFQRRDLRLGCSYGQTETTGSVVYSDDCADHDALTTAIGRPDPPGSVRICDEAGNLCPADNVGEIQVVPQFVMAGYLNKPVETAEAFTSDRWLKTGDLGAWRSDGTIRFVGRASDGFKSGGYNIYPREIERALEEHPAIRLAAVVGVPDALYDRVGYAFLMLEAGGRLGTEELQAWCRDRLANYKVPKRFIVRAELPLLAIGKVDKAALRREAAEMIGGP